MCIPVHLVHSFIQQFAEYQSCTQRDFLLKLCLETNLEEPVRVIQTAVKWTQHGMHYIYRRGRAESIRLSVSQVQPSGRMCVLAVGGAVRQQQTDHEELRCHGSETLGSPRGILNKTMPYMCSRKPTLTRVWEMH